MSHPRGNEPAAASVPASARAPRLLSTFWLDGLYLGVDVLAVQELIRCQEMTRVPLAPRVIRGLINLRGQIVTVVDLRRQFGLPERESGSDSMNVVVRTDDGAVGLLVDEIGDVVEADEQQFELVPDTVRGRSRELVAGVYKLEGRLLLLLDVQKAVSTERSAAKGTIAA